MWKEASEKEHEPRGGACPFASNEGVHPLWPSSRGRCPEKPYGPGCSIELRHKTCDQPSQFAAFAPSERALFVSFVLPPSEMPRHGVHAHARAGTHTREVARRQHASIAPGARCGTSISDFPPSRFQQPPALGTTNRNAAERERCHLKFEGVFERVCVLCSAAVGDASSWCSCAHAGWHTHTGGSTAARLEVLDKLDDGAVANVVRHLQQPGAGLHEGRGPVGNEGSQLPLGNRLGR